MFDENNINNIEKDTDNVNIQVENSNSDTNSELETILVPVGDDTQELCEVNEEEENSDSVEPIELQKDIMYQENLNKFTERQENNGDFVDLSKNYEIKQENNFTPINPQSTPIYSSNSFTPIPPRKDIKEDEEMCKEDILDIKKQNTILKWVLVILLGGIFVLSLFNITNVLTPRNSEVFVSELNPTRVTLTPVESNDKIYTVSEIYASNISSVVAIHTEIVSYNIFGQKVKGSAAGSGFIISEDGYVITNAHVIEGATTIKITLSNAKEYTATLIGSESENDIAVLKIVSNDTFKPVVLGNSDSMIVGEDVLAIGNPLGELTFSVTKGIISAIDREIMVDNFNSIDMFQVDCAVNQGHSGGPIFNMYGEVIGIVSAKYASETIEGLGFCIPISDAVGIVKDLIEYGQVKDKAYLGIQVTDLEETMIKQYNMVPGAYVSVVEKGTCAERAGLKIGDIIVELGDTKIENVSQLLSAKRDYKAGDTTTIKVYRSGEYLVLSITFGEYPSETVNSSEKIEEKSKEKIQEEDDSKEQSNTNDFGSIEDLYEYYKQYGENYSSFEEFFYDFFYGGQIK